MLFAVTKEKEERLDDCACTQALTDFDKVGGLHYRIKPNIEHVMTSNNKAMYSYNRILMDLFLLCLPIVNIAEVLLDAHIIGWAPLSSHRRIPIL